MSFSPGKEQNWSMWSETFRNSIDDEAQFTDNHESNYCRIIPIISQHIHFVTREYAARPYPLSDIEVHLHDIWYACIQAGRHIWGSRAEPDTLVVALASLKVSGPLLRPSQRLPDSGDANESVTFSDNREFWSDLPLFAVSLIDEFTHRFHQPDYGAGYCFNLATFVGRLLSVGIFDGPGICVLSLFREALEVSHPLSETDEDAEQIEASAANRAPSFEDRLYTLRRTIHFAKTSLVILVSNRATTDKVDYTDFPQLSSLGELTLKAGIDPSSTLGYSRERWSFWIQRLEELQKSEVENIQIQARWCLEEMREPAEDTALLL
ncbi:unnamed protein product [Clonostachys chloroleuca]|uniref:Uncharacterized protein n=1 Tax=Clonostachys chloroleuca TaxID=1926264 RepID=A0AA35MEX1_9HYPO|nr:unnamed protein product [Clonostachys chloroleuca]